jgi:urease accessory protein
MKVDTPPMTDLPFSNRARGALAAGFRRVGARTEVVGPHETGGYRLRLPRSHGGPCEAVIVNTGGGMAGGDRADFAFAAEAAAAVTLTTTAAEKVYRGAEAGGTEAETRIAVALTLGVGASLDWLPQETILFDGARLQRRLDVDMAEDADLLLAETLVFGRLGMGERMGSGRIRDRWRLKRGGRLVLAEELDLEGDVAGLLDRPALGGGARASATVVWATARAEGSLESARAALDRAEIAGGASAWNGMLVARAVSPSPRALRAAIVDLLSGLRGRALPRLWA